MQKSISRLNHEYNALLKDAQKRLERQRIRHNGRKGYVQSVHLNANGVRLGILLDDGHFETDIDALVPEYDPI